MEEFLAQAEANSYMDYHVKGLDYLCLKRSEGLTLKVYFFEGDVKDLPEVVNPHNHKYDFTSEVLSGVVENILYRTSVSNPGKNGTAYQRFDYHSPLNGGGGFSESAKESVLVIRKRTKYHLGNQWKSNATDIHTLRIHSPGTILLLRQFEDVTPIDVPTQTFVPEGLPAPSLTGLYSRFTRDRIVLRMRQVEAKTGKSISELIQASEVIRDSERPNWGKFPIKVGYRVQVKRGYADSGVVLELRDSEALVSWDDSPTKPSWIDLDLIEPQVLLRQEPTYLNMQDYKDIKEYSESASKLGVQSTGSGDALRT